MYERFRILLDEPAPTQQLGLNFDDYASALAELIRHSKPQFAMAIFGVWGSGKTTLMRAVQQELVADPGPPEPDGTAATIIPVWFNAWRYEKELHLIVPLLDNVRESLVAWVDEHPSTNTEQRTRVIKVASTMARAARALLAGLTINVGLPGAVDASVEANKVVTAWREGDDRLRSIAEEPQSFYHASFRALHESVAQFTDKGLHRIVVFVDDLDRCLPESALQVLESMKLFFDLMGFVFVVGLDQEVIERAVRAKYPTQNDVPYISGASYIKKIFQVPFAVPRVDESQLDAFLEAIIASAGLEPPQENDLRGNVSRHLSALTGSSTVNPREVKRFINAYTMQMKMLERKLVPPNVPDPDVVLALQALYFREDWADIYEMLVTDTNDAQRELSDAITNDWPLISVGADTKALPPSLRLYLAGIGTKLLYVDLNVYLSTLEFTTSTNPAFNDLMRAVAAVRRALANKDSGQQIQAGVAEISKQGSLLASLQSSPAAADLSRSIQRATELAASLVSAANPTNEPDLLVAELNRMEADMRELRKATNVGATSAA